MVDPWSDPFKQAHKQVNQFGFTGQTLNLNPCFVLALWSNHLKWISSSGCTQVHTYINIQLIPILLRSPELGFRWRLKVNHSLKEKKNEHNRSAVTPQYLICMRYTNKISAASFCGRHSMLQYIFWKNGRVWMSEKVTANLYIAAAFFFFPDRCFYLHIHPPCIAYPMLQPTRSIKGSHRSPSPEKYCSYGMAEKGTEFHWHTSF